MNVCPYREIGFERHHRVKIVYKENRTQLMQLLTKNKHQKRDQVSRLMLFLSMDGEYSARLPKKSARE